MKYFMVYSYFYCITKLLNFPYIYLCFIYLISGSYPILILQALLSLVTSLYLGRKLCTFYYKRTRSHEYILKILFLASGIRLFKSH